MVPVFKEHLKKINAHFITFDSLHTLQLNLGNLCNQRCSHCHHDAGPEGGRIMSLETVERVLSAISRRRGITLDITGGCPEMHPLFRFLVEKAAHFAPRRLVRSNLTILLEPGMEWLPDFYRDHDLVVIASLPCYLQGNVDRQRGERVFERSITALRLLNDMGYGSARELNLVYNPGSDVLPGPQTELEAAYRENLSRHGVIFTKLFTITNTPVGRFKEGLIARNRYDRYLDLLAARFNPEAACKIMCRTLLSIDWQGVLYNCDFNQATGLPVTNSAGRALTIDDLDEAAAAGHELVLDQHCYSCTAGEGSSCSGALSL